MTKHTEGRMTTDEADHCMPHENILLMVGTRAVACVWIDDAPVPDYNREQQANARRLVACWNALQDVPTEQLEEAEALGITDVSSGNLFSARLKMQREREELIQALREVRFNLYDPEIIEKIATATIAKVEGGAA